MREQPLPAGVRSTAGRDQLARWRPGRGAPVPRAMGLESPLHCLTTQRDLKSPTDSTSQARPILGLQATPRNLGPDPSYETVLDTPVVRLLPTGPAAVMGKPRVRMSRCVAVPCPFTRLAKKGLWQVPLAAMETPYCVARLSGSYGSKVPSGSKRETDQCHSIGRPSPAIPVLPAAKMGNPGGRDAAATDIWGANVRHRQADQAL